MKFFGKGTTTRIIEDPEEKRDKLVEVRRPIGTSIIYVHVNVVHVRSSSDITSTTSTTSTTSASSSASSST